MAKNLEELKAEILGYLEQMDNVKPGIDNIFRNQESKAELESKLWQFYRKVEAATYHVQRIVELSDSIRKLMSDWLAKEILTGIKNAPTITTLEKRLTFQDGKILFEIDAFLAAERSALDFLASALSRYIKDKKRDRFRKIVNISKNLKGDIPQLILNTWDNWAYDLVEYRDHLVHKTVIPASYATAIRILNANLSREEQEVATRFFRDETETKFVIFPIPEKPDPTLRLGRADILGITEDQLPFGCLKEERTLEIEEDGKRTRFRSVKYSLAPGFVEAEKFAQDHLEKLLHFANCLFRELAKIGFEHLIETSK